MPHDYKSWKSVFESPGRGRRVDRAVESLEDAPAPSDSNADAIRLCARLEQHWHKDSPGFSLERPKRVTEDEIQAYEQRNSLRLPADMREYFLRLNGIDSAPGFFRFFSLARLIPLKSQSYPTFNSEHYSIFADYMAGTWYYAIYLGEDSFLQNRVILPDLPGPPVLARNFSEFVELYLADSVKLYGNQ